jgi:hypothetical protein
MFLIFHRITWLKPGANENAPGDLTVLKFLRKNATRRHGGHGVYTEKCDYSDRLLERAVNEMSGELKLTHYPETGLVDNRHARIIKLVLAAKR